MPTLPIEHIPQENEAGCLAACSQMVLQFLGIRKSQRNLNRLFQLTSFGVPFSRLTRLERFGVVVSIETFGHEHELIHAIDQQIASIVFLRTNHLPYRKWIGIIEGISGRPNGRLPNHPATTLRYQ